MSIPYVSIIIPTYQDWHRLAVCLDALDKQTYPKENFEIIVVNNKLGDTHPQTFNIPENCKIIVESKPGSYAARNAGLKITNCEIIGFTDSDCIPDQHWIENAINFLLNNKEISRIAGNIQLFYRSGVLTTAELYEKVYAFKQEHTVMTLSSSVTGNMFSYKKVFEIVGDFREDLLSGGDHEWSHRAQLSDFAIAYVCDAVVLHPARFKIPQLIKKTKRIAGGRMLSNKRNKFRVLAGMIKILNPQFKGFSNTISTYGKDLTLTEKGRIFLLRYYLNFVDRFESVKVSFGKRPVRD